ncbi:DMT family transporter [Phaeobacter piscinae]|uniref:DMT family transporter n=1 Tax=Phaeobacter piscinae TaxID=1580596 RepID=UPI000BBED0E6|nr:DMT family transporter [Phaeobacter piscinae]ATG40892.1 carboxylate/amino acid/amine transporter [Phaeobacter piscinae]
MLILPVLAAVGASSGWATGIVLAQWPARQLGAFEFTRIQLFACSAILAALVSLLGYWTTIEWAYWPAFIASTVIGIVLGNLAMIECLRRGGPRRTELILSLKAPLVGVMAYVWLNETPGLNNIIGAAIALFGVGLAVFFGSDERSESDRTTGSLAIIIVLGITATAFQGFGFLVVKPAMQAGTDPLAVSALRLLGAAFLISVVALWPAKSFQPKAFVTPYLLGRTILPGFIGYGVSSTLLLYAFSSLDAGIAAVLGSLSPVLILPILWLKEGLIPRFQAIAGAFLAVAGTSMILLL